jgi:hypothetical protein
MSDETTPLTPVKGFGGQDPTPTEPCQLHSISYELVRAHEHATGEPLDLEVRLYYQGKEYIYAMPEADARELFAFPIGANSKFARN